MNLTDMLATNIMLGFVAMRYKKFPIELLYKVAFIFFAPSSFFNFSFTTKGILTRLQPYILNFLAHSQHISFDK
jgi:hypothetical protein